jgi:hypothetical protein
MAQRVGGAAVLACQRWSSRPALGRLDDVREQRVVRRRQPAVGTANVQGHVPPGVCDVHNVHVVKGRSAGAGLARGVTVSIGQLGSNAQPAAPQPAGQVDAPRGGRRDVPVVGNEQAIGAVQKACPFQGIRDAADLLVDVPERIAILARRRAPVVADLVHAGKVDPDQRRPAAAAAGRLGHLLRAPRRSAVERRQVTQEPIGGAEQRVIDAVRGPAAGVAQNACGVALREVLEQRRPLEILVGQQKPGGGLVVALYQPFAVQPAQTHHAVSGGAAAGQQ